MAQLTVFATLGTARAILAAKTFAVDEAALLLDGMLLGNFNPQIHDAIVHARSLVAVENTTTSRFALARVVLLLEKHVKLRVV